ncbi:MAG: DUF4115 domain-containing protein [Alphaproteobacteria bacterium]|nr:DUF4115 domain-containing protein [Alphaproteobacteria bacterium]
MTDTSQLSLTKTDLGNLLKQARETKALTIEDMANRLRIRKFYLEALEKNDFGSLPGIVYGIGFIRTYARALDLNENDLVALYKSQNGVEVVKPKYEARMPKIESRIPGGLPLIIGVVVASVIFFFWYFMHSEVGNLPNRISEVPEPLAQSTKIDQNPLPQPTPTPLTVVPPSTAPLANGTKFDANSSAQNLIPLLPLAPNQVTATSSSNQPGMAPAPLAINRSNIAPPPPAATNANPPPLAVKTPIQSPNPTNKPQTQIGQSGGEAATASDALGKPVKPTKSANQTDEVSKSLGNGVYGAQDARIVIKAVDDTWIEIVRKDDKSLIFSRLLKTGESYNVPNLRSGLMMSTGNAGGIVVAVDANNVPDLGPLGAVRRDIDLAPEKLVSGTAVPKQVRKKPALPSLVPSATPTP